MGLLSRWGAPLSVEKRSNVIAWHGVATPSINNPNTSLSSVIDYMTGVGGGTSVTHGRALAIPDLFAMVKIISEDIAVSAVDYQQREDKKRWVTDHDHYINDWLQAPGYLVTWIDLVECLIGNAALTGNGACPVYFDKAGRPVDVDLAEYTEVTIYEDINDPRRLVYHFSGTGLPSQVKFEHEVLHVRGWGLDGKIGISPVMQCAKAFGLSLEMTKYLDDTLKEGGYGGGVVSSKKDLDPNYRLQVSRYVRSSQASNKVPVLDEGMTFTPNKLSPQDVGFAHMMKFSREQYAAIYRIPLPLLQDRDFSGKADTAEVIKAHVKFCLTAWGRRLTEELERKLIPAKRRRAERMKMNFDGILTGDPADRADYIKEMIASQVMKINEARELIALPPDPKGDRFVDFQKSAAIDKDNLHTKTINPPDTSEEE